VNGQLVIPSLTSTLQEYRAKLVMGYLVVMSLIALLIQGMYRDYFETVVKLVFTEDYSYLLVAFSTVAVSLYLSYRYMGLSYEIQLSRVLSNSLLFIIAVMLYHASKLSLDYSVQLMGLSFAVMLIATIMFVFKPLSPGDTIPLITPLLTVPIPASVLDRVTTSLSRVIGKVAALLTGTKLVEAQAFTMIEVVTANDGVRALSIEAVCSGIAMLSAAIVIFPLLAYYITASREKALRKAVVSAIAFATGLLIGFVGNTLRVISIVLVAKYYGVEAATSIFHYSPSAIYALLSVITAYALISKLARIAYAVPRPLEADTNLSGLRWEYVAGTLILLLFMVSAVQVSTVLSENALAGEAGTVAIKVDSVGDFIENPVKYLVRSDMVSSYVYDAFLTRVTGSLAMYRISVVTGNDTYPGLLELVDTTGRLHTLQLCFSVQGYRVLNAWNEQRGSLMVGYIMSEKDGVLYLLTYMLTPVTVKSTSGDYAFYARVSLVKPYTGAGDLETAANTLLRSLSVSPVPVLRESAVPGLAVACSTSVAVLVIYAFVTYLYNLVLKRRRGVVPINKTEL